MKSSYFHWEGCSNSRVFYRPPTLQSSAKGTQFSNIQEQPPEFDSQIKFTKMITDLRWRVALYKQTVVTPLSQYW